MLTIKTKPDCTLGFLPIKNYPKEWPLDTGTTFYLGSNQNGVLIGKLSEITEEQARELVEKIGSCFKYFPHKQTDIEMRPVFINGNNKPDGKMDTWYLNAIHSLYSAAQLVGIEEKDFDKFLVIKL